MRKVILAAGIAAMAMLSAPSWSLATPAVDKDTVIVGVQRQIAQLDPLIGSSGETQYYVWHMFDTLYAFDSKGNLEPRLATGYSVSEDGLEYRFQLRDDVKFHNGDSFTSADVKFSMERLLNPEVKSVKRPFFDPVIASVEAPDATTVVFRLKKQYGAFINEVAGSLPILPEKYTSSLPSVEAFAQNPVGSGPYKFNGFKVGQELALERFDDYFGAKANIKNIIFKIVVEPSTRMNALKAGELDLITDVPLNEVAGLKTNSDLNAATAPLASPMYVRLYTRDEASPLSKRDVRMALNYAICPSSEHLASMGV